MTKEDAKDGLNTIDHEPIVLHVDRHQFGPLTQSSMKDHELTFLSDEFVHLRIYSLIDLESVSLERSFDRVVHFLS